MSLIKFTWNRLKTSIAGAKLSHLVLKDRIWDHGSMVEQVRMVFLQMEKALERGNVDLVRKYMTVVGFQKLKKKTAVSSYAWKERSKELVEIDIISVRPARNQKPDRFTALLIEREREYDSYEQTSLRQKELLSKQWQFVRQGNWWLLNEIEL